MGEVQLPVSFCLLAIPGTSEEQLNRVLSHSQVITMITVSPGIVYFNLNDMMSHDRNGHGSRVHNGSLTGLNFNCLHFTFFFKKHFKSFVKHDHTCIFWAN